MKAVCIEGKGWVAYNNDSVTGEFSQFSGIVLVTEQGKFGDVFFSEVWQKILVVATNFLSEHPYFTLIMY